MIEAREFERLGGRRTVKVDARLVALTNVDLDDAVRRRAFREDLFYRLNVVRLHVPPLRERREDIEELARALLKTYATKHGRAIKGIASDALSVLKSYEFPGNVRELANTIERALIVAEGKKVQVADLPDSLRASAAMQKQAKHRQTLAELEADYISETLEFAKGNKSEAARLLGISRKNLYEKLARYRRDEG